LVGSGFFPTADHDFFVTDQSLAELCQVQVDTYAKSNKIRFFAIKKVYSPHFKEFLLVWLLKYVFAHLTCSYFQGLIL
jgi:hypothetical protein